MDQPTAIEPRGKRLVSWLRFDKLNLFTISSNWKALAKAGV